MKQKVLVVEDDPADQRLIERIVDETIEKELEISFINNGQRAVEYLDELSDSTDEEMDSKSPHLAILDLDLPGLSGFDVLAEIRKREPVRRLPVVVFSTSRKRSDILKAYDLGANSYIEKPFDQNGYRNKFQTLFQYWFETVNLPTDGSEE